MSASWTSDLQPGGNQKGNCYLQSATFGFRFLKRVPLSAPPAWPGAQAPNVGDLIRDGGRGGEEVSVLYSYPNY